jgi:hypothetical protein
LVLDGIETGQKIGGRVSWQFRTFDPVDIQQLIHKAGGIWPLSSWNQWFSGLTSAWSTSCSCQTSLACPESDFFFGKQDIRTVDAVSGVVDVA